MTDSSRLKDRLVTPGGVGGLAADSAGLGLATARRTDREHWLGMHLLQIGQSRAGDRDQLAVDV